MKFPRHPALEPHTGFLLRKVSTASFEAFAARTAEHGLHPMHFGLLQILDADGAISQHELGRRIGIDPSTMVARLDVLEQHGMVQRRRRAHDRRAYEIVLTEKGAETLKTLAREARDQTKRFFGVLTKEEREALHRILVKLANSIDEDAAKG